MSTELDEGLLRYLADRDQQRAARVERTYAALTKREQELFREAAVMGYVRGVMAAKAGNEKIPKDSSIVATVIASCLSFDDLYKTINRIARRAERQAIA